MPSSSTSSAQRHSTTGILLLACALTTFPPVTGDIYLPSLPQLIADLGATTAQGQHTLAAFFTGLAVGQLFYGPLSDRIGRRPVMLMGAVVYLVATIGCYFAFSIDQLIGLRFLQALGACAGLVISTAIVRDSCDYQESARAFSMLLTARSLGPLLAPIAGGILVTFFGWRGIFAALVLFGAGMLIAIFFGLSETRPESVKIRAQQESALSAYAHVLTNRRILGYTLTNGLNFGSMFAWISVAPFLIITHYKVSEFWFGWIFASLALGIMGSAQLNRRALKYFEPNKVMLCGALFAVAAASLLLVTALLDFGGVAGIMVPLFLVICSLGFVSTNAMAGALAVDPSRTGSVSAVVGTGQFLCAAMAAWLTGHISDHPAIAMAVLIAIFAIGAAIFPVLLSRTSRRKT
ncbi:MAG: Bcr/CflA family efflux MFS transporter [Sphingobium sp.]|nr:Bcr/CflA family efflux MFS transporter [Sphingobium sp.]